MRLRWFLALHLWALSAAATVGLAQGTTQRLPPLPDLERRAAADSNDAAAHVQLGRGLLDKGRYDEAERSFRQAARLRPGLAEAYLGLAAIPGARGESYWKEREKQDGREAVVAAWSEQSRLSRLAFLLDPLVNPALLPRAEERVTIRVDGMNYRVWWVFPLAKAINAFRAAKFEDAKRKFDNLLSDRAAGPEGAALPQMVLWYRGLAAAHLGDYQLAATDFTLLLNRATREAEQVSVEIAPLLANDYRYMAAMMLFFAGQSDVASLLFREALGADPSLYMAHTQLAVIYERAGRCDDALAERRRAVDANPGNSDLLLDLGVSLGRAGKLEASLEAFDEASAVNPRDPSAHYHAGLTALRLGQPELARRSFERFITLAPSRLVKEVAEATRYLETLR